MTSQRELRVKWQKTGINDSRPYVGQDSQRSSIIGRSSVLEVSSRGPHLAGANHKRASALQPNDLPTLNIPGKAYWRAKNYSGVTQLFDRVMAVIPDSGRTSAAFQYLKAAVAANPFIATLCSNLVNVTLH